MFLRTHRPTVALLIIALVTTLLSAVVAATARSADADSSNTRAETSTASASFDKRAKFERWATITRIPDGFYYDAGQQDTHLVVTKVKAGLRYADTHTDVLRSKPDACRKKPARRGIVVVCRVPSAVTARNPMTVKVFTRLGNDYVNTTALPRVFKLYMLADAGRDVIRAGAANDFINGAQNRDRIWGGTGKDWIRTGLGNDDITGGSGDDRLVGVYGQDTIHGGRGNDRIGGGPGHDHLNARDGRDHVLCGTGRDRARVDKSDQINPDCERLNFA